MTNRRPDLVETSGGWEPHTSGGERMLVALAGMVLLGGLLIVGSNLLKHHDEASIASTSPSPTIPPLGTPFPTPSPQELVLTQSSQASSPSAPPGASLFGGWIRARVDLPVRSEASATATVVGTIKAGALAYVDQQDTSEPDLGWATLEAPSPTGWVAMRANGKDLVKRYEPASFPSNGYLWGIAAGDNGFVAMGQSPTGPTTQSGTTLFVSADGSAWHAASESLFDGNGPGASAWGPAGWIMATGIGNYGRGDGTEIWHSPDGEHWTPLGILPTVNSQGIVGSGRGYMLQGSGGPYGRSDESWFSADGITWTESAPGLGSRYQVTATEVGFYARATSDCCPSTASLLAAFSTDGRTWIPTRANLLVVAVGNELLGVEPSLNGSGALALRGSYYRGQLGWRTVTGGQVPFINAVVSSVVSDGQHATAFGWDVTTEEPLSWTSGGGFWIRQQLPVAFGGPPQTAAAGKRGVVAIGYREDWRGLNPVVWREGPTGTWEPEPSPMIGLAHEPTADACGAPPTDPADFSNLDRAVAVACFRSTPMTVRMWSAPCNGCSGQNPGTYDVPWLSNPTANQLYLCPVVWPDNCWTNAVLAPTLAPVSEEPAWLNAWLEVTGHFDDPAAASCHWTPPPDQLQYYGGARQIIDACRQQFVVTAIRVVKGP